MTIVFCIRTPRMSPTPLSLDSLLASTLLGFVLALGLVNLARGPRAWRRAGFGLAALLWFAAVRRYHQERLAISG